MTQRAGSTATVTVSLPENLLAAVRQAAGRRGVSSFVRDAVEEHVRALRLGELTDAIATNTGGPYTADEMAWADGVLHGQPPAPGLAEAA